MTKIITTFPVDANALQNFKKSALQKMIAATTANFESLFPILCNEFTNHFNADEWILMSNKDVYYVNDIVGILPNLANRNCDSQRGDINYNTNFLNNLKFSGFDGDLPTLEEARKCFVDKKKYFLDEGKYLKVCRITRYGFTFKNGNSFAYYNTYRGTWWWHGNGYGDYVWTIPFFRFNGENSSPATASDAIFYWLQYDLTPKNFQSDETRNFFNVLKNLYAKYKDFFHLEKSELIFDVNKILSAVLAGTEFDFLPDTKKILDATEITATDDFLATLKEHLLNCDKVRADLDPYDENILLDPNRGHWDLWDYGADNEKSGEITLQESLTARDPADDINHGIVAIDFGTKSTVVVYENDRLQILPLQVGNGKFSDGIDAKNYENPTVIQFIDIENFIADYNARAGRPLTKWNDVTVSHNAFENLAHSDSTHYYSFLTGLKHWCGSGEKIKLKDRAGVTKDLPPFLELMAEDVNPLEYYAYYLGLYINNMLQERRLFLKYIMSFPVTYDNAIRERMRRAFERGIKKSLPTALLSNDDAMKNFVVQDGASEPAAYAITALQEYGFDPEGDEENYYAVFDFGGGTTDFDFGVLRESELDRYDYALIHFGENGDRTLGGENLLKLLAFEVFKANQAKLLHPTDDKIVGKIPFTSDADKNVIVGDTVLIKNSQESHLNMHMLSEALRDVWENPDSDAAKKILDSGTIEVDLVTDTKTLLQKFPLYISFENSTSLDLKKILRDRIEQGVKNFFIAMKEAFDENSRDSSLKIKPLKDIEEISIFLAGNSSKSKVVAELFAEYLGKPATAEFPFDDGILKVGYSLKDGYTIADGHLYRGEEFVGDIDNPDDHDKIRNAVQKWKNIPDDKKNPLQKIFGLSAEQMPTFKIFPALGTPDAHALQKARGIEIDPNDLATPNGKTGVAFGLLKCRDSGNVQITHITPDKNFTPFQFYVGRNKKRKFKTIIDKNTKLGTWHPFIDAGNSFDILYSDLPEAVSNNMNVNKARRVNVTLTDCDPKLTVFIRAVKSNVIEYQIAEDIEDFDTPEKFNGVEPVPIILT